MYTIEEIKSIIYPKDKIDMVEVLKDLLKLMFKEGKLVTFSGVYLYDIGDPVIYLNGVALINGNLICSAKMVCVGCTDAVFIGTFGDIFNSKIGIRVTNNVIKKVCKDILEENTKIDFDFSNMKGLGSYYFCGKEFEKELKERESLRNKIEGFCNGTQVGHVEW